MSGASEALSLALGRALAARRLVSAVEHDSAIRAGGAAAMIPVDDDGLVRADALELMLAGGERAIVAIQWANSETGVRQPIAELAAIVHAAGGLLLVDAAQMPAGADAATIDNADFVVVSAHRSEEHTSEL